MFMSGGGRVVELLWDDPADSTRRTILMGKGIPVAWLRQQALQPYQRSCESLFKLIYGFDGLHFHL